MLFELYIYIWFAKRVCSMGVFIVYVYVCGIRWSRLATLCSNHFWILTGDSGCWDLGWRATGLALEAKHKEMGIWEMRVFFGQIMWNHTSWSSRCHIAIVMRMRKKQTAWDTEIFTTCQAWVYPSLWRQVGTRTGRDIFKHLHYFKMSFNIFMRKFHQIRGLNLLQPLWNPRLFSKWHFQILIWQDKNLVEKLVHDFAVENWVLKFSGKKGLRHLERLAGWTFWGAAGLLHSLTAQNRMISIPNSAHVLRWDMMIWSLWFLW